VVYFCIQEQGEEKLLALNKRMSELMSERAQEMSQRADVAWADVHAAKQRLNSLRDLIANLKRQAQTKRCECTCLFSGEVSLYDC
jgi:hypothetical protein